MFEIQSPVYVWMAVLSILAFIIFAIVVLVRDGWQRRKDALEKLARILGR